jgi:pilus assembly protein Flp/PilA
MTKLTGMFRALGSFAADENGTTAIEYAIIAAGIAAVIVVAVNLVGTNLLPYYERVAAAFN